MYNSNHRIYHHFGDIVIYGAGGHARTICSAVNARGEHRVAAFVVDEFTPSTPEHLMGVPVVRFDDEARRRGLPKQCIVGIGDNDVRWAKTQLLQQMGLEPVNVIHPSVCVGDACTFGRGVFLSPGCSIDPDVTLGDGVICNVHSGIGHGAVVSDYTHVSAGALIGALSKVGARCFFAMGTTLISGVNVGDDVYVGAGALITKDAPPNVQALGSPARFRARISAATTCESQSASTHVQLESQTLE